MIDEIYNYRQGNLPIVEFTAEWSKLCIPFEESLTEEQLTRQDSKTVQPL